MILDDERLHELRSTHIDHRTRPAAEITARARQLRRRRRLTNATVVTAAVALAGSAVTWGLPGPAPAPAAGPRFGAAPWPVPTAPYHALYEDVRVSFPGGPATCGKDHAVDLRDPAGDAPAAGDAALIIRPGCTNPSTGATVVLTAPGAGVSSGTGQQRIGPRVTADDCFDGMRNLATAGSETVLAPWPDDSPAAHRVAVFGGGAGMEGLPVPIEVQNLTQCVLVAPDPSRDLPLAMVRIELVLRDDRGIDATFTAWRGGTPALVRPMQKITPPPQFPRVKAVTPPYTVAYENVPLHLPGQPDSCDEPFSFYLRLQVPEVNSELGGSDAMLSRSACGRPPVHELQAGGVAIRDTDPTAQECATALESTPSSHAFTARVGWTLCVISQAVWPATEPKLVALTVTSLDATTGAFDLSATAWTGTGVPE